MADISSKQAAETLESTLDIVLKETGKFFRASQTPHDTRSMSLAKTSLSQTIPAANLRFHEALDDIEIQIIRAKSVFERDLASIRAKRAERARNAAGVMKAQSPGRVSKQSSPKPLPQDGLASASKAPTNEAKQEADTETSIKADDVMAEESISHTASDVPVEKSETTMDAVKTEPFAIPQELPQDPQEPKGLAISLDPPPSTVAATAHGDTEHADVPSPDTSTQNKENANLQDADFESMFNDTSLPDPAGEMDFNFSLPNDANSVATDLLNESAFQDISMDSNQVLENPNSTANEDITTLLPGLENYVNGPNDFSSMPNLSDASFLDNTTTAPNTQAPATDTGDANTTQPPNEPPLAPIESSFEDMFGIDSYMDGTGDDDELGTGNMGEVGDFDDSWFQS
ncbi:MAG: hypothetical protein Q9220_003594 [cf. Caloplaca sp. 1 TL-2023]